MASIIMSREHHVRMSERSKNPLLGLRMQLGTIINYALPIGWPYDHPTTLDGGCGVGIQVVNLRNIKVPTWGMEIDPRIIRMAVPNASDYIYLGSLVNTADVCKHNPRAAITLDVCEHMNNNDVTKMQQNLREVGVKRLVHAITTVESPYYPMDDSHINPKSEKEWYECLNNNGWKVIAGPRNIRRRGIYTLVSV